MCNCQDQQLSPLLPLEDHDLRDFVLMQGDAEDLPLATDGFDRYVSAGSIEYWPDPQRGIREAYRVIKPGGLACLIGPVHPTFWLSRFFADVWMLFPTEAEYMEVGSCKTGCMRQLHTLPMYNATVPQHLCRMTAACLITANMPMQHMHKCNSTDGAVPHMLSCWIDALSVLCLGLKVSR